MTIKNRNVVLCIVFSLITCGIYGIYWFVKLTNESNSLASEENKTASGGVAFILSIITCNIYGLYWSYKMGKKTDEIKGTNSNMGIIFLVLSFVGLSIVNYIIAQLALNEKSNA